MPSMRYAGREGNSMNTQEPQDTPDDDGDRDNAMLCAVAAYLEIHGWTVSVIGGAKVQHVPGEPEFNFEFVLKFTGIPPDLRGEVTAASDVAPGGGEGQGRKVD